MKLLTVTVPCYNSQDYMEGCLESLLPGGDRLEIIIINDGSKDNTGAIADRYAEKYPNIIRVIHQENGGHGEGINQGLLHATGTYFKVVDSDDRVSDDFVAFLDGLEECEKQGGVDLALTNYRYTHADGKGDRSICYKNALPKDRIFGWQEMGKLRIHQHFSLHSSTFRTELMRKDWQMLPKHAFYEDNYMVSQSVAKAQRLFYTNKDLYLYTIGREGQTVQHDIAVRKYQHHLNAARDCFCCCKLDALPEKKQRQYLSHFFFMLFAIGACFTRLNDSDLADADMEKMWEQCRTFDRKNADHFRYGTLLRPLCAKGKAARKFACFIYRLANKVVRFN